MISPLHRILAYGRPGIGKSTLIAMLIAYVAKKFGQKTRVIGGDGGGSKAFDGLVKEGMAEYWPLDQWVERGVGLDSIFLCLQLAGRGYWPADPATPGSELLPPKRLYRECPKCKEHLVGAMPQACPSCKEKFGQGVRLPINIELINGVEKVGAYCFDGLTYYGDAMLDALKMGNPAGGNSIVIDGATVSAPGQGHYGAAQSYIATMVGDFHKIPTRFVLATAKEKRGVTEEGTPLYGPALPGKALTDVSPGWFTDAFHMEGEASKDEKGVEQVKRVVYFTKHFPPDTKPYGFTAKTSAPIGGGMPDFMEMKWNENFWERYFTAFDAACTKSKEILLG